MTGAGQHTRRFVCNNLLPNTQIARIVVSPLTGGADASKNGRVQGARRRTRGHRRDHFAGVRTCDLRRARYIGQARTHLQRVLTAVALNVVRLTDWGAGRPRIRAKSTHFVALFFAAA